MSDKSSSLFGNMGSGSSLFSNPINPSNQGQGQQNSGQSQSSGQSQVIFSTTPFQNQPQSTQRAPTQIAPFPDKKSESLKRAELNQPISSNPQQQTKLFNFEKPESGSDKGSSFLSGGLEKKIEPVITPLFQQTTELKKNEGNMLSSSNNEGKSSLSKQIFSSSENKQINEKSESKSMFESKIGGKEMSSQPKSDSKTQSKKDKRENIEKDTEKKNEVPSFSGNMQKKMTRRTQSKPIQIDQPPKVGSEPEQARQLQSSIFSFQERDRRSDRSQGSGGGSQRSTEKYIPLTQIHDLFSKEKNEAKSQIIHKRQEIVESLKHQLPFVFEDQLVDKPSKWVDNKDYNEYLKDFGLFLLNIFDLSEKKLDVFVKIYRQWLQSNNHEQNIYKNGIFNKKLLIDLNYYIELHNEKHKINQEDSNVIKMVLEFSNFYLLQLDSCLKKLYQWSDLVKTTNLFEVLWECTFGLQIGVKKKERTEKKVKIKIIKEKVKLCKKINSFLSYCHHQFHESYHLIPIKSLIKHIAEIDHFEEESCIELAQKIILPHFCKFNKKQMNKKLVQVMQQTKGLGLLPFRMITHHFNPEYKAKKPYIPDLYRYVKGQEWTSWLMLNLSGENRHLPINQKEQIVKIIKKLKISVKKCRQYGNRHPILLFITQLKQDNLLDLYFEALTSLLSDYESVEEVEKYYFKNDSFKTDFQALIEDVQKYPNNYDFSDEFERQFRSKAKYLLKLLSIIPDRAFYLENLFFDIYGFMEEDNLRCDRICHLIIDFISYFESKKNDEDFVGQVFLTFTSFLKGQKTKECMILAMNTNKPSLINFTQKKISDNLASAINSFVEEVFKQKQFYEFIRDREQNKFVLAQFYIERYNSEEYVEEHSKNKYFVPFFWINHSLKAIRKQKYNPSILELLLSKLNLSPSQVITIERPQIFETIIQTINGINFWQSFISCLQPVISYRHNKVYVTNQNLIEDNNFDLFSVFYSLRLLRTMLKLFKILKENQEKFPRHPFMVLLSGLKCVNDVGKYFLETTEKELGQSKLIPMMGLFALLGLKFRSHNITSKQHYNLEETNFLIRDQFSFLSADFDQSILDCDVLKNFFLKPQNKELSCYENLASLSLECLSFIFSINKNLSLDNILFSSIPKNSLTTNEFKEYQQRIYLSIVKNLMTEENEVSRCGWKFILALRESQKNHESSRELFQMYLSRVKKLSSNPSIIHLICQFLRLQTTVDANFYEKAINQLISSLEHFKLELYPECINSYKSINFDDSLYYQMVRYRIEKQLVFITEVYNSFNILIGIVSEEFFKMKTGLQQKISHLVRLAVRHKIFTLPFYRPLPQSEQIFKQNKNVFPRDCGPDPFELLLTNPHATIKKSLQAQVSNVLNWCYLSSNQLLKTVTNFISVLLSVDETFYENHPIKIQNKQYSNLFCHLHLGVNHYQALDLMGRSNNESVGNVRNIIVSILDRIQEMKYNKEIKENFEFSASVKIIDMCLSWLNSRKKHMKDFQTKLLCKRVLIVCFPFLGQPIYEEAFVKLLLTIVNIASSELNQQYIFNIRETILQTLKSRALQKVELKQQLLCMLSIIPPENVQQQLIKILVQIWTREDSNVYFYNQSRVILTLCEKHPIAMASTRLISRCNKLNKLGQFQKDNRYIDGMRTGQSLCWIWMLKICVALLESSSSVIVLHEVNSFVLKNKERMIYTLRQIKKKSGETKKKNTYYDQKVVITYAQLQQLQATLELIAVISTNPSWVSINRNLFEEFLYTLLHYTLPLFTSTDRKGGLYQKAYLPVTDNEKILWKMKSVKNFYGELQLGNIDQEYDQFYERNSAEPNMFILAMHMKFQACFQAWLLACSSGLKESWMVQEYFSNNIPSNSEGGPMKYSSTYWEHLNKVIIGMLNIQISRIAEWSKWKNKNEMLQLLKDCYNSPEMFTEQGYLTTITSLPLKSQEIATELTNTICLCLEFGICHLLCELRFKKKYGLITQAQLQKMKENLLKYGDSAEKTIGKWDSQIYEHEEYIKKILAQLQKIAL